MTVTLDVDAAGLPPPPDAIERHVQNSVVQAALFHGSKVPVTLFDTQRTVDGGLHFGTHEQAKMRNAAFVMEVRLAIRKAKRVKDDGGNWALKIRAAKRAGYDGIVYLNRYEGFTTERMIDLQARGLLNRLDGLSDRDYRRLVPEAADSYIAFDATQVLIVGVTPRKTPEPALDAQNADPEAADGTPAFRF